MWHGPSINYVHAKHFNASAPVFTLVLFILQKALKARVKDANIVALTEELKEKLKERTLKAKKVRFVCHVRGVSLGTIVYTYYIRFKEVLSKF